MLNPLAHELTFLSFSQMTSKVLVGWLYARVCEALTNDRPLDPATRESIPLIGKQLIHILMACRHKVSRDTILVSY